MAKQPEPSAISDPITNYAEYERSLLRALVATTKAVNALPLGDLAFYKSLDRTFAEELAICADKALYISNRLVQYAGGDAIQTEEFKDVDDLIDRYGEVIDVVDNLLEKTPNYTRGGAALQKVVLTFPTRTSLPITQYGNDTQVDYKFIYARNIVRPQLRFKDPPENSANTPWIRKIKEKPNALVPLDYGCASPSTMTPAMSSHILQTLGIGDELRSLPHPYEYEINNTTYPFHFFEQRPEQMYQPFDTTSATWVDTEEALVTMCRKLEGESEIAVDLEHHDYRSFQGIVCLMQISTREEDFVVDTLELRDKLSMLNQSFTDPAIVKVFHGAESDILWLQRDFGVYIVDLFDTYHASHLLGVCIYAFRKGNAVNLYLTRNRLLDHSAFPAHSLASLLARYCNVTADKKYQLADWRIRPLPTEMLKYARSDTHYLLYIYDCMRNELLQKSNQNHNLLRATLQRSQLTALRRYEKEGYDHEHGEGSNGWRWHLTKNHRTFNSQQFAVYKAIHAWRDQAAREEDESIMYVLPNHMLFTLSERMPTDSAGVIGCCNPCPPMVRMYASDLGVLISRAKLNVSVVQKVDTAMPKAVHSRFDEEAKEEMERDGAEVTVTRLRASALYDDDGKLRSVDLEKVRKRTSVLFGSYEANEDDEDDEYARWRDVAEKIRASLMFTVPGRATRIKTMATGVTLALAPEAIKIKQVEVSADEEAGEKKMGASEEE
ncbi:ribonuclease H-like domain-containing protein [Jimgerdemannia flammicorona]|uniref:Ribonuclease H-like domain-containing protein n=1 Tax=Jimgerdemannia flammicorona TaxID=994334 RepID=A0A433QAH5_9FUNG|nr:ribonuclease H-like domain-containing protein [Jimgerdemannia flammicorona]